VKRIQELSPRRLAGMIQGRRDFVLLDVQSPEQSHLPGTDDFIPAQSLAEERWRLPPDPERTIVLYCRDGSLSASAAGLLAAAGFRRLRYLSGGIEAWEREGYPVEGPDRIVHLDFSRKFFMPDRVAVRHGDWVRLILRSRDGTGAFAMPNYGIAERIEPGKSRAIEFCAAKPGEFPFFSSFSRRDHPSPCAGRLAVEAGAFPEADA